MIEVDPFLYHHTRFSRLNAFSSMRRYSCSSSNVIEGHNLGLTHSLYKDRRFCFIYHFNLIIGPSLHVRDNGDNATDDGLELPTNSMITRRRALCDAAQKPRQTFNA